MGLRWRLVSVCFVSLTGVHCTVINYCVCVFHIVPQAPLYFLIRWSKKRPFYFGLFTSCTSSCTHRRSLLCCLHHVIITNFPLFTHTHTRTPAVWTVHLYTYIVWDPLLLGNTGLCQNRSAWDVSYPPQPFIFHLKNKKMIMPWSEKGQSLWLTQYLIIVR